LREFLRDICHFQFIAEHPQSSFYDTLARQTGQILTSSFINKPIQKKINVKTSKTEKTIQPAVDIFRSTIGK